MDVYLNIWSLLVLKNSERIYLLYASYAWDTEKVMHGIQRNKVMHGIQRRLCMGYREGYAWEGYREGYAWDTEKQAKKN